MNYDDRIEKLDHQAENISQYREEIVQSLTEVKSDKEFDCVSGLKEISQKLIESEDPEQKIYDLGAAYKEVAKETKEKNNSPKIPIDSLELEYSVLRASQDIENELDDKYLMAVAREGFEDEDIN